MVEKVRISKRTVDALEPRSKRYTAWDTEISGFGIRVTPNGRKTYILKYRVGGGRDGRDRWGTIGQHGSITPDQARNVAQKWAASVPLGGDPAGSRIAAREAPTVSDLLDSYLEEHVEKRNKPKTILNNRLIVENLLRPKLGHLKVADVTANDVSRFHGALHKTPYMANRAIAALSKAMGLAELWGMRPDHSNPCRRVQRYREEARERYLNIAEFQRLGVVLADAETGRLKVPNERGEMIPRHVNPQAIRALRLLILTGGRKSEIIGLRWENVSLEAGRAILPDTKTGRNTLQLPPPAVQLLADASQEQGEPKWGFVVRGADRTDPECRLPGIDGPWKVIRKAAGLEGLRLHDLRHAYASVAVASGLSLPMIGALLGHREVKTTARYAHLADDPQKAAADLIAGTIDGAMKPGFTLAAIVADGGEERES